ncbi:MAG: DUF6279 family lipoprotein [Hydrogenophaga sp.]
MNTSLGANIHPLFRLAGIITGRLRRLALAGATVLLASCSALQLGYNQAHTVLYWWIDGYADLNDAQSAHLRKDLDALLGWHRQQELPVYAQQLQQWRALAAHDLTADQVCREVDVLSAAAGRLIERAQEPLARLALTLTPAQRAHLQRHHEKGNAGFEKDFVRGSDAQRLERRLERTRDRYESLYGPLTAQQTDLIRQDLRTSPFDAARSLEQRRERQAEMQTLVAELQASQARPLAAHEAPPRAAVRRVQAWLQRGLLPTTGEEERADWVRHGCAAFARLHNSTTPPQRRHAQQVLQGYEADLRALAAQR